MGDAQGTRVFLSSDMEGTAGVVDWQQCLAGNPEYEQGCRLLLGEVNAAIDGALAAGAREVLVNDSHSAMRNLAAGCLHGRAGYLSGRHKPLYMMQGLDASYDAIFFVSYHGAMGSASNLSHTYNPGAVFEVRLNGTVAAESGINALVAQAHGVPIALITGDQIVGPELAPFSPDTVHVAVKESVNRLAAASLHPEEACDRIRDGAARALAEVAAGRVAPPNIALPATLAVDLLTADMAEMATWIRGVERTGPRTVEVRDDDPLRLYRTFVTLIYLTRSIVERR